MTEDVDAPAELQRWLAAQLDRPRPLSEFFDLPGDASQHAVERVLDALYWDGRVRFEG